MKKHFLILALLYQTTISQYVYTQLGENLKFDLQTPQVKTPIKLGDQFQSSQQYSIWGWFKFTGSQASITNILNISNNKTLFSQNTSLGPFPNPQYPDCPLTQNELKTSLEKTSPRILNNPNCFPQKLDKIDIQMPNVSTKEKEVLFVNYDLNPRDDLGKSFSITFLVQNGEKEGAVSDMKIDGFVDIAFVEESWSFFAISCDYKRGTVSIYYKVFDSGNSNSQFKTLGVDFGSFSLKKNSELILASVEQNEYFNSVSGFVGNMAYIEMSSFYTSSLQTLWVGYLNSAGYGYKGVIIEFFFDLYNRQNGKVKSYGLLSNEYDLEGNYQPLFEIDKNRLGVRFKSGSKILLNEIDFLNNDLIKGFVFYFKMKYKKNLPSDLFLVERGFKNENGYIKISLVKNDEGNRFIRIVVKGHKKNGPESFVYDSKVFFVEGETFYVMAGVATAPSGAARIVYLDNTKEIDFPLINDDFQFNTDPQNITVLGNNDDPSLYKGYIDLYNFKIFNSATAAEFFNQIQRADEKSKFDLKDYCELNASHYRNAEGCFECKNKVLSVENNCIDYCPLTQKNPLNDKCIKCLDDDCDEIDKTQWNVEKIDKTTYRIKPSRRVLSKNIDFENMVDIKFDEKDKKYDYDIKKTINKEEQFIDYDFTFKNRIVDKNLNFSIKNSENPPQYDINRNLLYQSSNSQKAQVLVNTIKSNICYIKSQKKNAIKAMAITTLVIFLLSFLILLSMTILCFKKFQNLGALWKFLLHTWMKLQLIAFFVLLGIYLPCCVQEFLKFIYKYAVSWDHAFRNIINDINDSDGDYNEGMIDKKLNYGFDDLYVRPFILHNMMVAFIVQCVIFFVYVVLKIWDCAKSLAGSFIYKLFVFLEFTGLIIGYLIVHMHAFVFSAINFKQALFSYSYFTICFLISICYTLVFAIFWFYSLFRFLKSSNYFMNEINQNKFYYFYAGYKDSKFARTWDHWMVLSHFIVGLMIGILYNYPLTQVIIILICLIILFGITIIIRPWKYMIFNIAEILMQFLIIVVVLMFLILAAYDKDGFCDTCKGREGAICWLTVILLFLTFLIGAIALILQTCKSAYTEETYQSELTNSYNDEENIPIPPYKQSYQMVNTENLNNTQNSQNIFTTEKNITQKNITNVKNTTITENNQTSQNLSMGQFMSQMNNMKEEQDESYINSVNDIITNTNQLQPDSADEEFLQPNIMRALSNNNSFDGLMESRSDLDQKGRFLSRKKQEFYDAKLKSSFVQAEEGFQLGDLVKESDFHSKDSMEKRFRFE